MQVRRTVPRVFGCALEIGGLVRTDWARNLLGAERDHGTDARGAIGREPGRDQSGRSQRSRGDGKCDWIERANFVKHTTKNFSGPCCEQYSQRNAAEKHD